MIKKYKANVKKLKDTDDIIKCINKQLSEAVKNYSYTELKHIIKDNIMKATVDFESKTITKVKKKDKQK